MGSVAAAKLDDKTRARVAKLIGMLSSANDGEVVNAARLIGSTLKAAGSDINDLAAIVKGGMALAADQHAPFNRGKTTASKQEIYLTMVRRALARLQDTRTEVFLLHLEMLLVGGRTPSENQIKWLIDIYARSM